MWTYSQVFVFCFFVVTIQPDPFPVLTPPRVPTAVTSPSQNTGITIHPLTQSINAIFSLLLWIACIHTKWAGDNNIVLSSHVVLDILLCPSCTLWISVGVTPSVSSRQTQPVVVTQPQPVPVSLTYLSDNPGVVRCPHCHHVVTTKVTYLPGRAAWCMCTLLAVMGWDTDTHMSI